MTRTALRALLVLSVLGLVTCSSRDKVTPPTPGDTEPPTVTSVQPAEGTSDLRLLQSFIINFSEAMNPATCPGWSAMTFCTFCGTHNPDGTAFCVACGKCIQVCPFGAIQWKELRGGILKAEVLPSVCQGCGLCNATCPPKAVQLQHSTDNQILAAVNELCA